MVMIKDNILSNTVNNLPSICVEGAVYAKKSKYANFIRNLGFRSHTLAVIRLTP